MVLIVPLKSGKIFLSNHFLKMSSDHETSCEKQSPTKQTNNKANNGKKGSDSRKYQARLTPWQDAWEMERVAVWLGFAKVLAGRLNQNSKRTSSSVSQQEQEQDIKTTLSQVKSALDSVAIWKRRGGSERSNIPHALETMGALAQVICRDYSGIYGTNTTAGATISSTELRLAYAAAVVRGINGLADAMQQQRATAGSVSSLCTSIGIPLWLVDVRHEASHNELPALPVLRLAASCLLGFLEERYVQALSQQRTELRAKAYQLLLQEINSESIQDEDKNDVIVNDSCTSDVVAISEETSTPFNFPEPQPIEEEESSSSINSISSGNEDESEEDTGWSENAMAWGRSLGTNVNRFAALLADKPPRRDPPTKALPNKKKTEPKKKWIRPKRRQPEESAMAESAAETFVKRTPLDIGFHVALSYLVWGYNDASKATAPTDGAEGNLDDNGNGNCKQIDERPIGALFSLPPIGTSAPLTESFEQIRQRFRPLLLTIGRAWPGFCHALLVHLIEFVMITETSAKDVPFEQTELSLSLASLWVRVLLSNEFITQLDSLTNEVKSESKSKKKPKLAVAASGTEDSKAFAPLSVLQERMEYPLNSICDRLCEHSLQLLASKDVTQSENNMTTTTSRELERFLLEILGESRQANFGAGNPSTPLPMPPVNNNVESSLENIDDGMPLPMSKPLNSTLKAGRSGFSLAEMEAMLSDEGVHEPSGSFISGEEPVISSITDDLSPKQRPTWVKFKSWEPCAIGTLPGYPV